MNSCGSYEKWLKNLNKLGPTESSILIVLVQSKTGRGFQIDTDKKKAKEIISEVQSIIGQVSKPIYFKDNRLPQKDLKENEICVICNYTHRFSNEIGNQLLKHTSKNVIIIFQHNLLDNPEFLDNFCTIVVI